MREEDSVASAENQAAREVRFPGESETGSEIVPIVIPRGGAVAIYTHEFDHAGGAGNRVNLTQVGAVHAVIGIDHRRIHLPPHAEVQGEGARYSEVVLHERRVIPAMAIGDGSLGLREGRGKANQHTRETIAAS